jgi:radical SAM superfamily enzyme YgiQ (UPF0313 family)
VNKDILLVTLNSAYPHSSFGLRYLLANLGELQDRAEILEFTIQKDPRDIAEILLRKNPLVIGLGVYIWNAVESLELVSILKKVSPRTLVILGGPEVSHESESQKICEIADYTIKGEGDFLFSEFCQNYFLNGTLPANKFISGPLPDIKKIKSPYKLYSDEDIRNRVIYVELSRGCPYKCEYCLSSLDKMVRNFDVNLFLEDIRQLIERGARKFKFIDRTFNLSPTICNQVLQFFLDRVDLGIFLHFEMVPDRLPAELRELIKKFPDGSLQFEIGIQTWNAEVAKLVSRRNDLEKVKDNFLFLADETGVHTHADLIVGLPGEDLNSFAKGFDVLSGLRPHEIQVGILKRLKGAPISRHDNTWEMVYSDSPPFQILRTKNLSYDEVQTMTRFAKFWDLFGNSGLFKNFIGKLKVRASLRQDQSFFWEFFAFNSFLKNRYEHSFGISQISLYESAHTYLIEFVVQNKQEAESIIIADYQSSGKTDIPKFLKVYPSKKIHPEFSPVNKSNLPKRQFQHLVSK